MFFSGECLGVSGENCFYESPQNAKKIYCQAQGLTPGPTQAQGQDMVRSGQVKLWLQLKSGTWAIH